MRRRFRRTASCSSTTATSSSRSPMVANSRRRAPRVSRSVLLLALSAAALAAHPSAQPATRPAGPDSGWRQFRGTARLTGIATGSAPATLQPRWTYDAGDAIESSAAIHDGSVYVGSAAGDLLALDLETGKLRWKYA